MKSLLLLFLTTIIANCQNPVSTEYWDSLALKNQRFVILKGIHEKETAQPGCVIFVGNSLTEGGQWSTYFAGKKILNRGIAGDISSGVLLRIKEIARHQPSKVFIEIGINDLGSNIPLEVILINYQKIIESLKSQSPKTKIYVQSLFPVNDKIKDPKFYEGLNEKIITANAALRKLALNLHVQFVNIYPELLDGKKFLNNQYTYDGLHLNQKGYNIWSGYLKTKKYL